MDSKRPVRDGLDAAKIGYEENVADKGMMLTGYREGECVDQGKEIGVAG